MAPLGCGTDASSDGCHGPRCRNAVSRSRDRSDAKRDEPRDRRAAGIEGTAGRSLPDRSPRSRTTGHARRRCRQYGKNRLLKSGESSRTLSPRPLGCFYRAAMSIVHATDPVHPPGPVSGGIPGSIHARRGSLAYLLNPLLCHPCRKAYDPRVIRGPPVRANPNRRRSWEQDTWATWAITWEAVRRDT